jgi:hypothetical protein
VSVGNNKACSTFIFVVAGLYSHLKVKEKKKKAKAIPVDSDDDQPVKRKSKNAVPKRKEQHEVLQASGSTTPVRKV